MSEARIIAKAMKDGKLMQDLVILTALANRHGLITGATGTGTSTGKTVTLQRMAEQFSHIGGVPVFLSDVKSDLSGISAEVYRHKNCWHGWRR